MARAVIIKSVGIVSLVISVGGFAFLPDPQSLGVGFVGIIVSLCCLFLSKVTAEGAIGTDDAPPSGPI